MLFFVLQIIFITVVFRFNYETHNAPRVSNFNTIGQWRSTHWRH